MTGNDDECFPRGKVTPAVAKAAKAASTDGSAFTSKRKANDKMENLFNDSEKKSAQKAKKSKYALTPEEEKSLAGKNARTRESKFIVVPLSYEQVVEGMLSLGIIRRIENHQISVSLPGRTGGVVSITNISTPYLELLEKHAEEEAAAKDEVSVYSLKQMFHEGQYVVVKVMGVDRSGEKVKVDLSMNPKDLYANYNTTILSDNLAMIAAVKSEEDHGFVMDVGINGATCFLPKSSAEKYVKRVNHNGPLGIGQLIYCKVQSVKMHRLQAKVTLLAAPTSVWSHKMDEGEGLTLDTLIPGMLVDVVVMKTEESGAMVHCLGLDSLVHQDHMNGKWDKPESLTVGSTVSARVLYTLPHLTTPYLSLNCEPAPLKICKDGTEDKVGTKQTVRIVSCGTRGIVVRFNDDNKGIVSLNHIGDDSLLTKEDIAKKFKVGSEHPCAVFYHSAMDRMHLCSFKKHLLEGDVFHFRNALPGMKVKCEIEKWNKGGALVKFGEGVRGFIPSSLYANAKQMSVTKEQSWRNGLIGKTVKARIMYQDEAEAKIILTTRKEFVNSKGVVLSSLDEAEVGMIGDGLIKKFNKGGVEVQTIGGLKGFIPISKLSKVFLKDVREMEQYQICQAITYKIIEKNSDRDQAIMTAILDEDDQTTEVKASKTRQNTRTTSNAVGGVESVLKTDKKKRKRKRKNKQAAENDIEVKTEIKDEKLDVSPSKKLKIVQSADDNQPLNVDLSINDSFWSSSAEQTEPNVVSENARPTKNQVPEADPVDALDDEFPITGEPETADDLPHSGDLIKEFEDGIISSPNVASYWIKLMTQYKTLGNMEKARVVAMQGVDRLDFRNEKGKIKIWGALLDLEIKSRTPMAKIKDTFQEACRRNDEFECMKMMTRICGESSRPDAVQYAEQVHREIVKLRSHEPESWVGLGTFYYRLQKLASGRNLFKEAYSTFKDAALNKQVILITKFALLELHHGEQSRGESMLDRLLAQYPRRCDLWLLYANSLTKIGALDHARGVFHRAFEESWNPRKAKPLLKRFQEFEDVHGTESTKEEFQKIALKALNISSN